MQTNPPDKLLAALNFQLDRAVRVVPHPRDKFASAVRAMQSGSYDTPNGRYDASVPSAGSTRAIGERHHGGGRCRCAERESKFLERSPCGFGRSKGEEWDDPRPR